MNTPASNLTIGVLGLGHVGLPTALGFAELGWSVIGADDNGEKARLIGKGIAPFYEPRMEEMLRRHLQSGKFRVSDDVGSAIKACSVLFVCVGTPQGQDGAADLSQIEAVARIVALNLDGYKLIVEKSTSPVRTAEQIKRTVLRYARHASATGSGSWDASGKNGPVFDVAVNPEFLREGLAMADFFSPDRIVIGVESQRARDLLTQIYQPLMNRLRSPDSEQKTGLEQRLLVTDPNTAELIKHASNAFLSTKISFINMLADLCDSTGADISEVQKGLQLDHRIGRHFLDAGAGFGGYCLPKDLRALIHIGESHGVDMTLLRGAQSINDTRVDRIVRRLRSALWVLDGKTIGIWGLAFKAGTDDVREAPSEKLVARLLELRCKLRLHDPQAMEQFQTLFPADADRISYCKSADEAANGADALVLMTEWPEFARINLEQIRDRMVCPVLIDGRNLLDATLARRLGFEYYGMGRRGAGTVVGPESK